MLKVLCVASVLAFSLTGIPTAQAQQPPYCVGFSATSCEQIRSIVERGVGPAYCVPGFARIENPQHLTDEQTRICYAMPPPRDPAEQRRSDEIEARMQRRRQQQIEDARALVRENWDNYGHSIEAIEIGFKCDVIDQLSARVSIGQIQVVMDGSKNRAGLIGDATLDIQKTTNDFIQAGKDAVLNGACGRITPASRARLREMVSDLMR